MSEHENENEEVHHGPLMPFVTVTSKGGPHDDASYVAGYEMGELDAVLGMAPASVEQQIHAVNAPQADLIAMMHGYQCVAEQSEDYPEWMFVTFTPADPTPPQETP